MKDERPATETVEPALAAARSDAVFRRRYDRGAWRIGGERARELLNGQVTADTRPLGAGVAIRALHLSPKGKVLADFEVAAIAAADLRVESDRERLSALFPAFSRFALLDDCRIDELAGLTVVEVAGPAADSRIKAAGIDLPAGACTLPAFAASPSADAFQFPIEDYGLPARRILLPASEADRFTAALEASGVREAPPEVFEILRIEAGRTRFGVDFDLESLAPECAAADAIDYEKGCYVGQEVVARIRTYGQVNRRLVRLFSSGTLPPGSPLLDDSGEDRGRVTSSAWSSLRVGGLAIARVHRSAATAGTRLHATVDGRTVPATVEDLPHSSP